METVEFLYYNKKVKQIPVKCFDYWEIEAVFIGYKFIYSCDNQLFDSIHKLDEHIDPNLIKPKKSKKQIIKEIHKKYGKEIADLFIEKYKDVK